MKKKFCYILGLTVFYILFLGCLAGLFGIALEVPNYFMFDSFSFAIPTVMASIVFYKIWRDTLKLEPLKIFKYIIGFSWGVTALLACLPWIMIFIAWAAALPDLVYRIIY